MDLNYLHHRHTIALAAACSASGAALDGLRR